MLVAGGMGSSYGSSSSGLDGTAPGTLAGLLQAVMDHNHCLPDRVQAPLCSNNHFPAPPGLVGAFKSIDCSPTICAALLYGAGELEALNDGGAHAAELREGGRLAQVRAVARAQAANPPSCTPLAPSDDTLWALGLGVGTDKVAECARARQHALVP